MIDMRMSIVKKLLQCVLLLLISLAAQAEYDASDLDKLFTDKKQRSQIDAARSGKNISKGIRQTSKVNVNGYLTRSDGKGVVWVNKESTLDSHHVGDVKVDRSSIGKNKKVKISVDGKSVRLKPGETWHKETGEIVESR